MNEALSHLSRYFKRLKAYGTLVDQLRFAGGGVPVSGLAGSSGVFLSRALEEHFPCQVHIFSDSETAAQRFNDWENSGREGAYFLPASHVSRGLSQERDQGMMLLRAQAMEAISETPSWTLVTYADALLEPVVPGTALRQHKFVLNLGERISQDFLAEWLQEAGFTQEDMVYAPGQFALRGSLVDVFSYASEWPVRIEFEDDLVSEIRRFDPDSQISQGQLQETYLLGDPQQIGEFCWLHEALPTSTLFWLWDIEGLKRRWKEKEAPEPFASTEPQHLFSSYPLVFYQIGHTGNALDFGCHPQPSYHKNFDLLVEDWRALAQKQRPIFFFSDQPSQEQRMREIMEALKGPSFISAQFSIHEGFLCGEEGPACFADHLIFDRYRRFKLRVHYVREGAITLRDLARLKPGDYVTHIDHGIGRFAGLVKLDNGGVVQECIRLIYKDGDELLVSIHNLHKIARYTGAEGQEPALHKLGGTAWKNTKARTKKRIKQLAFDLLKLYARRRMTPGFAFSPDTYLQQELESSFMYEDTPDQLKATEEVKADMEKPWPMDRLICGDVGFGKTEIAIRAAFKAACDSKQTAVLAPTTILALQHYNTFFARLQGFPVRVEYLSRFRSPRQQKAILEDLAAGKIDIIIGTHILVGSQVKFKDLGLLIIDEEQKFGVNVKEKLRNLKATVDTLTLTATPIPRTLQFSLMGARDMSIIRTPPPNRQPIATELHTFNEKVIREAIRYELQRGGQVFFVHNRVQDLEEVAAMVQRLVPEARVATAHGQMEGRRLEEVLISFLEGQVQVLVSTAIVESGLDVPNANTIIIHNAHQFGLSDLHQLRGRVGRSNRKAFCYLVTPPLHTLTEEAQKRLKAIAEFTELGSGLQIALRDLDIRGAGDLLGAEQSGFISEMGYDTYQKILDEAIRELRAEEAAASESVSPSDGWGGEEMTVDCVLETDLSLLLPDTYVSNITERLALYREMDELRS
ncbi:MAG: transcription-repair coupling factor, partial [Flavobacteriales bacterium]|nr:transcription-repair coupling factor [Flavobacteriales bacterium]MDW8410895.1 transcription-repair coupling factor [Flavobacteriales bacterium]